jgi:hypothetical protein
MNSGRTWGNAPVGVRGARILAYLGIIGSVFMIIALIAVLAIKSIAAQLGTFNLVMLVVQALFLPLYIWLLGGLKRGDKAAYYVQLAMSIIGLLSFPLAACRRDFLTASL